MIGDSGGFDGRCPLASATVKSAIAVSPAPETSNTSRARVGNVKMRFTPAKEHHAVLAERDQHHLGDTPFIEKCFTDFDERGVLQRRVHGIGAELSRGWKRFAPVWRGGGDVAPGDLVVRIRIDGDDFPGAARALRDAIDKRLVEQALVVARI